MLKKVVLTILLLNGLNAGSAISSMTIQPGTPKLPEMVEKADVIVVGQIQSTNTGDISKKRDRNTFTYKITFDSGN